MLGRTPHELLSVESNEGEYVFLIEVKAKSDEIPSVAKLPTKWGQFGHPRLS